jgi:hypothetical protein
MLDVRFRPVSVKLGPAFAAFLLWYAPDAGARRCLSTDCRTAGICADSRQASGAIGLGGNLSGQEPARARRADQRAGGPVDTALRRAGTDMERSKKDMAAHLASINALFDAQ